MKARTIICTALALLAVAAPAANARPTAHAVRGVHATHATIPSDHDASVATQKKPVFRCFAKHGRWLIVVISHSKCGGLPNRIAKNA